MDKKENFSLSSFGPLEWLSVISGILTILTFLLIFFTVGDKKLIETIYGIYVFVVSLIFLGAMFYIAYRYYYDISKYKCEYIKLSSKFTKSAHINNRILKSLHEMGEITRLHSAHMRCIAGFFHDVKCIDEDHSIDSIFDKFLTTSNSKIVSILNHTSDLFSILTSDDCAVCVKIKTSEKPEDVESYMNGNWYISTTFRDEKSARKRTYDKSDLLYAYSYKVNSAFSHILDTDSEFYAEDNLDSLGNCYQNLNPRRSEFYNSVAVHAIRFPESKISEPKHVRAFLCVDNKKGQLKRKETEALMSAISHILSQDLDAVEELYREFNSAKEPYDELKNTNT